MRPSSSARPATPGSPPTPSACPTSAPRTSSALVDTARELAVDLVDRRARGAAGRRRGRRPRGIRDPGLRPERGRRRARGIEGVREGADEGGRGADRRPRPAPQPRGGGRAAGGSLLPGGAEGRRAGGGQGGDPLRDRGRGARGRRCLLHRAALRRDGRRPRGVPRGRGALDAGDLRRRERRPAGARPGLQADLRRRRGAEHRRHGQLLAGARLRADRGRGDRRHRCTGRWSRRWRSGAFPSPASSTPA